MFEFVGRGSGSGNYSLGDTHRRDVIVGADTLGQQSVADLPGEYGRTLPLVPGDLGDYSVGGDPRLGTADGSGLYGTGLVVPATTTVGVNRTQLKKSVRNVYTSMLSEETCHYTCATLRTCHYTAQLSEHF